MRSIGNTYSLVLLILTIVALLTAYLVILFKFQYALVGKVTPKVILIASWHVNT